MAFVTRHSHAMAQGQARAGAVAQGIQRSRARRYGEPRPRYDLALYGLMRVWMRACTLYAVCRRRLPNARVGDGGSSIASRNLQYSAGSSTGAPCFCGGVKLCPAVAWGRRVGTRRMRTAHDAFNDAMRWRPRRGRRAVSGDSVHSRCT